MTLGNMKVKLPDADGTETTVAEMIARVRIGYKPKGHKLVFKDGNSGNLDAANLQYVSK